MDERVSPDRQNMWTSGAAYEQYVGRWSRQVAREFLKWVVVPPGRRWLDVGCGPGALSQAILDQTAPSAVMGIDPSTDFIAFARAQVRDARVRFEVGDARSLPSEAGRYDAVVSGLALNFVPQPDLALAEMVRVTRPGGSVAVYVWDYAGQMQWIRYFWDAAVALDPAAVAQDEGRRFPLCRPEALAGLFRSAGLRQVETRAIDVPTIFRNFEDYWSPFLGGQGPAPGYVLSLSEAHCGALRDLLRAGLPMAPDGSIHLIARAWAVSGRC